MMAAIAGFAPARGAEAAEATLIRDTWGVPHAMGDTEPAAFFALGYAQAEDRLADIYTAIRTATGRLAEVQGDSVLEQDYLMRVSGNDRIHAEYLKTAPPHLQANVAAFTDGIKAYIADHPMRLPTSRSTWSPGIRWRSAAR